MNPELIKGHVKASGLKLIELAARHDVHPSYLSAIIHNRPGVPNSTRVQEIKADISQIVGLPVDSVFPPPVTTA